MTNLRFAFCAVMLGLPFAVSAQEFSNSPGVWRSAGHRKATVAEIQALIAVPGPSYDRNIVKCRAIPPPWGKGTPVDEAAAKLVEIGSPAIPYVKPLLDDIEPWRRCLAVEIMGRIGDKQVVPDLASYLYTESSAKVRLSMVLSLSMLSDVRAEVALIRALQDTDLQVQYQAMQALSNLKTPLAVEALVSLLALPSDPKAPNYNAQVWVAKTSATALKNSGQEAFLPLLQVLKTPRLAPVVLAEAISSASAVGDRRLVPVLYKLLKHPAEEVRDAAVNRLTDWKDERTIPTLIKLVKEATGVVQQSAARQLARDGSPKALEALGDAVIASNKALRQASANALPALTTHEASVMLLQILQSGDTETMVFAVAALGNLQEEKTMPELARVLNHREAVLRCAVVNALDRFKTPKAIDMLLPALLDSDPEVRSCAVRVLRNKHDDRILPALRALGSDPNEEVRNLAKAGVNVQKRVIARASERL